MKATEQVTRLKEWEIKKNSRITHLIFRVTSNAPRLFLISSTLALWSVISILTSIYSLCPCTLSMPQSALSEDKNISKSLQVHVFTMIKDDGVLLLDWFSYHSALFGVSNMHIADNESTDPETQQILEALKGAGVDIISYYGFHRGQGIVHSLLMQRFAGENGTFLVGLDVDEFIVAAPSPCCRNKLFCVEPECVLQAYKSLPVDGKKYKFLGMGAFNCIPQNFTVQSEVQNETTKLEPTGGKWKQSEFMRAVDDRVVENIYFTGTYQPVCGLSKTFYNSVGFMLTDMGNHGGRVRNDGPVTDYEILEESVCMSRYHSSNLILIHYSTSSYDAYKKKITRGAIAHGYHITVGAGMPCGAAPGQHYCEAWWKLQNKGEESFRTSYEKDVQAQCESTSVSKALSDRMSQLRKQKTLAVVYT